MTEPEVWKALEDHYRQQNWTGVAVLADWFEEQQQTSLANTLRWLSRRETADRPVIYTVPTDPPMTRPYWYRNAPHRHSNGARSVFLFERAVRDTHKERTEALEDLL
jgi:hypothetical protein